MRGFIVFVACVCALFALVSSSAIPMWEFLSKDEKMSFLYNMFESQVHDVCDTPACRQEILKYGLSKLKAMPEEHLDMMDPYQRGSNDIIWASMMQGHPMMRTTTDARPTTTAKPNSYDDQSLGEDIEGEASAKIETVYRVSPPTGFIRPNQLTSAMYPPPNKIQETVHEAVPPIERYGEYHRIPLTGPIVIKVHLDGTPVREDTTPLPQDDDLRQYQLSKLKIPNL